MSEHAPGKIPWPTSNKWGRCPECGYRIRAESEDDAKTDDMEMVDGKHYHARCV